MLGIFVPNLLNAPNAIISVFKFNIDFIYLYFYPYMGFYFLHFYVSSWDQFLMHQEITVILFNAAESWQWIICYSRSADILLPCIYSFTVTCKDSWCKTTLHIFKLYTLMSFVIYIYSQETITTIKITNIYITSKDILHSVISVFLHSCLRQPLASI